MKNIAIIGAGLAGAACGWVLQQAGAHPVLYEAGGEIAPGASGNDSGLYNPRLSAELTPESLYYKFAFERTLETFETLHKHDIGWHPCGALHLMTDEKRAIRYQKTAQNWGWGEDMLCLVSAREASEIAGVTVPHDALFLPRSGVVSPKKLCAAYTRDIEIHLNRRIENLAEIKADAIIIANGMGALRFPQAAHLPLRPVRGQVTAAAPTPVSAGLKTALCYGGYIAPVINGAHMIGATFQRWLDHSDIITQDNQDNIDALAAAVPALGTGLKPSAARAAIRATTPDHVPLVGALEEGLYISAGHGSHGIISSLIAAHMICALILKQDSPLPKGTVERLSPLRYHPGSS